MAKVLIIRYRFSASDLNEKSILNAKSSDFLKQFNEDLLSIDFQRTRNSTATNDEKDQADPKARRFYEVGELHIVACCLFSRTTLWEFIFCDSDTLPLHPKFSGRYSNNLTIDPDNWHKDLLAVIQ
jgi:hypothetical protein